MTSEEKMNRLSDLLKADKQHVPEFQRLTKELATEYGPLVSRLVDTGVIVVEHHEGWTEAVVGDRIDLEDRSEEDYFEAIDDEDHE